MALSMILKKMVIGGPPTEKIVVLKFLKHRENVSDTWQIQWEIWLFRRCQSQMSVNFG
jgi:uncharacterized protein YjaG (DUF416 family)